MLTAQPRCKALSFIIAEYPLVGEITNESENHPGESSNKIVTYEHYILSLNFHIVFWYPANQVSGNYSHCIQRHSGSTQQNYFMRADLRRTLTVVTGREGVERDWWKELGVCFHSCPALLQKELLQRTREGNMEMIPHLFSKLPDWPVTDKRRCARGKQELQSFGSTWEGIYAAQMPLRSSAQGCLLRGLDFLQLGFLVNGPLENNLRLLGQGTFRSQSWVMF